MQILYAKYLLQLTIEHERYCIVSLLGLVIQQQIGSEEELRHCVTSLPRCGKWLVMMLAGGHFAAAVFDKYEQISFIHFLFHYSSVASPRTYAVSIQKGSIVSQDVSPLRSAGEAGDGAEREGRSGQRAKVCGSISEATS